MSKEWTRIQLGHPIYKSDGITGGRNFVKRAGAFKDQALPPHKRLTDPSVHIGLSILNTPKLFDRYLAEEVSTRAEDWPTMIVNPEADTITIHNVGEIRFDRRRGKALRDTAFALTQGPRTSGELRRIYIGDPGSLQANPDTKIHTIIGNLRKKLGRDIIDKVRLGNKEWWMLHARIQEEHPHQEQIRDATITENEASITSLILLMFDGLKIELQDGSRTKFELPSHVGTAFEDYALNTKISNKATITEIINGTSDIVTNLLQKFGMSRIANDSSPDIELFLLALEELNQEKILAVLQHARTLQIPEDNIEDFIIQTLSRRHEYKLLSQFTLDDTPIPTEQTTPEQIIFSADKIHHQDQIDNARTKRELSNTHIHKIFETVRDSKTEGLIRTKTANYLFGDACNTNRVDNAITNGDIKPQTVNGEYMLSEHDITILLLLKEHVLPPRKRKQMIKKVYNLGSKKKN